MQRFPSFLDGEPLIYHRLFGMKPRSTIADVQQLMAEGFTLMPFDERCPTDDEGYWPEECQPEGVDMIDLSAGDGQAVFFSVGKPIGSVGQTWLTKRDLPSYPGVAYKLSTFFDLCDRQGCTMTLRPTDLQSYYFRLYTGEVQEAIDNAANDNVWLELWQPLQTIREHIEIEVFDRTPVFDVMRNETRHLLPMDPSLADIDDAATAILNFLEAWHLESEDLSWDVIEAEFRDVVRNAIDDGVEEWRHPRVPHRAELLFWGNVPLAEADLVFDYEGTL